MSKILIDEATVKLALEALEQLDGIDTETECVTIDVGDVITSLRKALAEKPAPVQQVPLFKPLIDLHPGLAEELKAINATAQQEPVAKMGMYEHKCPNVTGHRGPSFVCQKAGLGVSQNSYCNVCTCPEALNTSPPAQSKPLTVGEVEQILAQHNYEIHGDRARYIVRMTEAAHGIKEKA